MAIVALTRRPGRAALGSPLTALVVNGQMGGWEQMGIGFFLGSRFGEEEGRLTHPRKLHGWPAQPPRLPGWPPAALASRGGCERRMCLAV